MTSSRLGLIRLRLDELGRQIATYERTDDRAAERRAIAELTRLTAEMDRLIKERKR